MKSRLAKVREDNDDLFAQIDKWVSLMMMNLLWVVFALPLITLPAGTAALFTVLSLRVRGKQPELFQEFFGALRRHWLTATLLGLANLLLVGLLLVNVSIFPIMNGDAVCRAGAWHGEPLRLDAAAGARRACETACHRLGTAGLCLSAVVICYSGCCRSADPHQSPAAASGVCFFHVRLLGLDCDGGDVAHHPAASA
jgi:hypothetical protein